MLVELSRKQSEWISWNKEQNEGVMSKISFYENSQFKKRIFKFT